ncbi:bifunctional 5,10-methylenetetrahydrofolate dehydrogenase/5,10-methenyltetrahydrofolate cyclohydrolase [Pigmentibacter sp. JX0631]|uniref:bifunctional 5,10-methylenetetrahydrofolate dehydrogenase/5,10-methenyltetrahydrofolate cyclohydrolase n=1 Tax=Pigmentibacter sp. JX0631 TaxID=2976982 RepID=UPI0024688B15|nr:bifunctional 5,10-methylenetetrahydrofolate dehydrogenase/5,10-methenyltetrahydrofolate cyclohydrolase [Pigmentibacter sp. JX0631]WGL59477.1 bifunctional 5,10-methylenetetrahydrofolate dehydrogenase/5,10-methenyltetrahydrofolate cyclohydrolase [Pigmentibacter sp. JX0631]
MKAFKRAESNGFIIPDLTLESAYFENTNCKILDGKKLSNNFVQQSQALISARKIPCLAVILVGSDPASKVYVNNKIKIFKEAGFLSKSFILNEADYSEQDIINLIISLNKDENIDGILVQLPLPKKYNSINILNTIDSHKDVDGFLAHNMGSLATGEFNTAIACTPFGVMVLLHAYGIQLAGKHAVVIGRSNIVGKPMGLLLLSDDATVTLAHSKTKNLKEICKSADVIVAAAGQPEILTSDYVSNGAIVVDVGIHRKIDGKLCGDVHSSVKEKASALTPVPGGVGPMTIAMLLLNTALSAWDLINKKEK